MASIYDDPTKLRPASAVPGVFQPPPAPSKFVMPTTAPVFNTPLSERGTALQRVAPGIADRLNPQARPVAIPKGPQLGRASPVVPVPKGPQLGRASAPAPVPAAVPPVNPAPAVAQALREPNAGGNVFTNMGLPTPAAIQQLNRTGRASEAAMGGAVTALEKGPLGPRRTPTTGPRTVSPLTAATQPGFTARQKGEASRALLAQAATGLKNEIVTANRPVIAALGAGGTLAARNALGLASNTVGPVSEFFGGLTGIERFQPRAAAAAAPVIEPPALSKGPSTRPIRTPEGNLPFAFRPADGPEVEEPGGTAALSFAPPRTGDFSPPPPAGAGTTPPAGSAVGPAFDQGDGVLVERGGGYGGGPIRRSLSVAGQESPVGAPDSFEYFRNAGLNPQGAVEAQLRASATAVDAQQARAQLISAGATKIRADVEAKLADRPAVVEMLLKQKDGSYTYGYAVTNPNNPREREVFDTGASAPFNAKEQRGIGNVRRETTSVTGERDVQSDPVVLDLTTGEVIGGAGKPAGARGAPPADIPNVEETDEYQEAYQLSIADGADAEEADSIAREFARRRRSQQLELASGEE